MEKNKFWTARYALINITYFMAFCTIHAFAAVYLLDRGFSNTEVGIVLAVANIVSAICQPILASFIDKPGWLTNRIAIMLCSLLILLGCLILLIAKDNRAIIFVVFSLIYMIQFAYQPVLTALVFEYQKAGCNIFYGLARGLGSAGFAVTSAFMGNAVENFGVSFLLWSTVVIMLLLVGITYFFRTDGASSKNSNEDSNNSEEVKVLNGDEKGSSLGGFLKAYPTFIILLIATIFLFFAHNMLNDYLIQVIRSVGGSEKDLGYATFLAALLELPTMAAITLIIKKISPNRLLIISGVFFSVKVLIMLVAQNMFMVYLSQAMQLLAYAVFIPASAYYVNQNMKENDQVKGQAFITCCFTIAGVFSSLVCGAVLDKFGVSTMLVIGSVVSVLGTAVMIRAMISRKINV